MRNRVQELRQLLLTLVPFWFGMCGMTVGFLVSLLPHYIGTAGLFEAQLGLAIGSMSLSLVLLVVICRLRASLRKLDRS